MDDKECLVDYFRSVDGDGLALDAGEVCGLDHLRSALWHARRSFERGENVSKRLLMETLLYASGERQLSIAIQKMGVKDGSSDAVLILLDHDVDGTLTELGLHRDDTLITVSDEGRTEDALERVALVDILKR